MNNKWFHLVSLICTFIIAFAVILAIYMLADGVYFGVPLKLSNGGEVFTTASSYHPGDEVQASFTYCKQRDIQGFVDYQLVDTYVRFYPAERFNVPLGCHTYNIDLGKVPGDVASEDYHFTGTITYRINSLTSVTYQLYSNSFTVKVN
jgi:hypothetical protein